MPRSTPRVLWTEEETCRLLIGYNRYYGSTTLFADIERDTELRFKGVRTNVKIKDRLRTLKENDLLTTYKSFFVLKNTSKRTYEPRQFIPEECLFFLNNDESKDVALS